MGYEIETQTIVKSEILTLFTEDEPLLLECGTLLPHINVAYETYGELNAERTNAILICHALLPATQRMLLPVQEHPPMWTTRYADPGQDVLPVPIAIRKGYSWLRRWL